MHNSIALHTPAFLNKVTTDPLVSSPWIYFHLEDNLWPRSSLGITTRSGIQCNVAKNQPHELDTLLQCHLKQLPPLTATPVGLMTVLPPKSDCPLQPELFDHELDLPTRPSVPLLLALDAPAALWLLRPFLGFFVPAGSGGSGIFSVTPSHLQLKVFPSVGILMHYPLIFSTQFSTLMEMLDGGPQIKVRAIATFSASWSNNCSSTIQGTEYLQPVLYITPYFQSPRKIRA